MQEKAMWIWVRIFTTYELLWAYLNQAHAICRRHHSSLWDQIVDELLHSTCHRAAAAHHLKKAWYSDDISLSICQAQALLLIEKGLSNQRLMITYNCQGCISVLSLRIAYLEQRAEGPYNSMQGLSWMTTYLVGWLTTKSASWDALFLLSPPTSQTSQSLPVSWKKGKISLTL